MTKDATIREIHHRVKNNLQTVSALLRLQSRRSSEDAVKVALAEAERRVQAIATVHAALSQNVDESVDFDEVARTIVRMAGRSPPLTTASRSSRPETSGPSPPTRPRRWRPSSTNWSPTPSSMAWPTATGASR